MKRLGMVSFSIKVTNRYFFLQKKLQIVTGTSTFSNKKVTKHYLGTYVFVLQNYKSSLYKRKFELLILVQKKMSCYFFEQKPIDS